MSAKNKVLENSFLYTFSSLLIRGASFLLLPLYTYFLTPEENGTINLVNSFIQIATFLIAFSLNSSIVRFFVEYQSNNEKLKRFLGTIIIFICISSTIFLIIGFVFNDILTNLLFDGISFYPIVVIALLTLAFITLHRTHQSTLQAMQRGRKLTVINLIVFAVQVVLNVFFIVLMQLGATGMLLAQLITYVGYVLFMMVDLSRNKLITICIDINILRDALKYSIPLLPHNLSTPIANFASRIFVNMNVSLSSVGLYSVAMQIGAIIDTVQVSVNKAFVPWFFNIMEERKSSNKKSIVELSNLLLILYSILFIIVGLFSQEAIIIMTADEYLMAWTIIPIFVLAYSVKSIYYFFVNILFYYKNAANKIFIASLTGSFADIILAFLLIPLYGMYGAAVAFLIARMIVVFIVIIISKRYDNIYPLLKMFKIVMTSWLFMGIGLYFSYTMYWEVFSWWNVIYKSAILVIYLLYIYITNKEIINELIVSGKLKRILRR